MTTGYNIACALHPSLVSIPFYAIPISLSIIHRIFYLLVYIYSVQHHLLWQKLSCTGVSTKVLNLLINTYAKARCCIRLEGGTTASFRCDVGVRQGCPILFTLFTCDLLDVLREGES